ncbi:hypothetical protein E2C01_065739 [Portunus trituberculatus]|uniref:Uncharacterized protein n=1 Tax=Portunus trituberculatus TaxID=210409 RepID=A0A5B7HFD8_PORTR|nr:hypothetical protein [Portunus trituberculatus]
METGPVESRKQGYRHHGNSSRAKQVGVLTKPSPSDTTQTSRQPFRSEPPLPPPPPPPCSSPPPPPYSPNFPLRLPLPSLPLALSLLLSAIPPRTGAATPRKRASRSCRLSAHG